MFSGKAKANEETEFSLLNEYFEFAFNAAWEQKDNLESLLHLGITLAQCIKKLFAQFADFPFNFGGFFVV